MRRGPQHIIWVSKTTDEGEHISEIYYAGNSLDFAKSKYRKFREEYSEIEGYRVRIFKEVKAE